METQTTAFHLDGWLVEPRLNRVMGRGETVSIEPKVMQVLCCLAEHPGTVLDREQLLEAVWGDTVVTDHVLTRSISELRRIFQDDTRQPRIIETIPKTGYRLIAPVLYDGDLSHAAGLPTSDGASSALALPAVADVGFAAAPAARPSAPARGWLSRRHAVAVVVLAATLLGLAAWLAFSPHPPVVPLHATPFTTFPGVESEPAFSPDGKQVAFLRNDTNGRSLYVQLVGTDSPLLVVENATTLSAPTWSPDGRYVAFRQVEDDGCGVFAVPALGGPARRLAACEAGRSNIDWSPDGAWLALAAQDSAGNRQHLYLTDPKTGARQPLTQPPPATYDFSPHFSPDGRAVAFLRSTYPQMTDLYVVSTAGNAPPHRLTFDNRHIAGLTWTPDGKRLLFSSNRAGNFQIWSIPASGGTPVWQAALGTYDPGSLDLTPEGRLIYEEWDFEINIWRIPLIDAEPSPVLASTRWDFHARYAPDGQRIAFASNRSGSFEIWVSDSDGTNPHRLTDFGGPYVSTPRWSPDGRHLVFDARVDGRAMLFILDADGGQPARLTDATADDLAASWSQDGRWIYFASNRSGTWQVWKQPTTGSEAVQITREGGYMAFEAPDGETLYFSKYGSAGLWNISTDGGDPTLVLPSLAARHWGNWTITPTGLYFIDQTLDGQIVSRYDEQTGATEPVYSLAGHTLSHEPGLSIAPDGRHLLLAFTDRAEADLILVEGYR